MKKLLTFVLLALPFVLIGTPVFAEDGGAAASNAAGLIAIGAGLAMGLGAAGCGLAQGRAAASALEGIARNPGAADKLFTPMILGLALIESIAIYALVIAFMLQGKI